MGLQIRVRVSVEPFLLIRPSLLFFLGLGLRIRPNPNPLFFFLTRVRVRVGKNPLSCQIRTGFDLFCSLPCAVERCGFFPPRGGGGDRGASDVRHPRSLSLFFYPVRVRVT